MDRTTPPTTPAAPPEQSAPATLTLTVELEFADDTFRGHASDELGAVRDFSGWLGLIAAIDAMIDTAPARLRARQDATSDHDARGRQTAC